MAEEASEAPQSVDPRPDQHMEVDAGSIENPTIDPESVEIPLHPVEPQSDQGMEVDHSSEAVKKREREESVVAEDGDEEDGASKMQKLDESIEEERLETIEENVEKPANVKLGPLVFGSSTEMFDYFFKLLHNWSSDLNINKYEHMALLDLVKKGHAEPDKKMGGGIEAFQVRYHPMWKSRCFFLVRVDGSSDDFSFRKCIDNILPLPESIKVHNGGHQKGGGRGGGGGRRGGRGRGRKGGW